MSLNHRHNQYRNYLEKACFRYDAVAQQLYCALPWYPATLRIHSWSEGCRVVVEGTVRWDVITNILDLPVASGLTDQKNDHPLACYSRELPQDVVRAIAVFGSDQLAMLRVCAASPRGGQLLENAPVLLWLLAPTLLRKSGANPKDLHDLLGLRQQELLALYCGYENKALLRLLVKVPLQGTTQGNKRVLAFILAWKEACALLRHKRVIDWQLLECITNLGYIISSPLARDILRCDMAPPATARALADLNSMVRDATSIGLELGITDAAAQVAACTRFETLQRMHDAWTSRLNSMKLDAMIKKYGESLPQPPLPGMDGIQPIESIRELLLESMCMHHCVGSYIEGILSGRCYIYRVTKPERATLEIRQTGPGVWEQAQLKSYCNRPSGENVAEQVQKWLLESASAIAQQHASGVLGPLHGQRGQAGLGDRPDFLFSVAR